MKRAVGIVLALTMIMWLAGCGTGSANADSAFEGTELTIAAAASLKDVTAEIAQAYKAEAPDVTLTFTYGASGALQTQIEQGAPVDIFMSAAQKQMDAIEEQALLLDGSRLSLLENKVVMIVPKDSALGLTSFEDLAKDAVKTVAMGDPASVPAGQYAEEALASLGIKEVVFAKTNLGTDVRQVLTWVEIGEVDAGLVYLTDAVTTDKVTVVCEAPESDNKIIYPVAILGASANAQAAQAFIDYLKTPDIAVLFEKYGFIMAK